MEQLSSSVVSTKDFEEEIWGSIPLTVTRRMNIYTFDIFIDQCCDVERYEEPGRSGMKFHYLTTGPLNLPESSHMAIIKEAVRSISSLCITSNWWTGFSSWEDFSGLLRSGIKLPIHTVVNEINRRLEKISSGNCWIYNVSENGDLSIDLWEHFPTLHKDYQVTAKRKRLRTLKQIAAYNVAKNISCKSDVQKLHIPQSLYALVSVFLDTYSGDYRHV